MEYKAIKEFCNVSSSKRIFASQYVDEGIPFYRQKEIIEKSKHQIIEEPMYISLKTYEEIKKKYGVPKKDDLLLTAVGVTLGIPYVVEDEEFYFKDGNLIWLSNFKESVNSRYVYYWISSDFGHDSIYMRSIGSAQPAITIDMVKKYKMFLPVRKIQDNIVNILSAIDDSIHNNIKRINLLEQLTENLYKEWFVRFRFPGCDDLDLEESKPRGWIFGDREITLIPKGWHFGELSELGSFVRGKNITAEKMVNGNIPVISAGVLPSGYHNECNVFGKSITVSASGANAGFLLYHLDNIWAADCSYYQNEENLWFVYNSLKILQPVISNMQAGAAQPHVYPKHVNRISMIIPEEKWIKKYCEIVEPIYEEIKLLKNKNDNLIKQRDLLLPRLMSGKLDVK